MSHTDHVRPARKPKEHDVTIWRGHREVWDPDTDQTYWPWFARCICGRKSSIVEDPLRNKRMAQNWRRLHEQGRI